MDELTTAPTPAPTAAACSVLAALDLAVCVPRSRIIAEPAGATVPVVLALGATIVDRWVFVGAVGAAAGFDPKKPKPLDFAGVFSGAGDLVATLVLAGVGAGAGAVACRVVELEPNEPKPPPGLDGAGAVADCAGADGLELELEEPPAVDLLEFEDE